MYIPSVFLAERLASWAMVRTASFKGRCPALPASSGTLRRFPRPYPMPLQTASPPSVRELAVGVPRDAGSPLQTGPFHALSAFRVSGRSPRWRRVMRLVLTCRRSSLSPPRLAYVSYLTAVPLLPTQSREAIHSDASESVSSACGISPALTAQQSNRPVRPPRRCASRARRLRDERSQSCSISGQRATEPFVGQSKPVTCPTLMSSTPGRKWKATSPASAGASASASVPVADGTVTAPNSPRFIPSAVWACATCRGALRPLPEISGWGLFETAAPYRNPWKPPLLD
jgi:hypothetical protein